VDGVPPTPDFSANIENTCIGAIEFKDISLNMPTSWAWNFGDGTTSNLKNPVHTYTENGIYNVSLTVTNINGSNTMQKEDFITVEMPDAPIIEDIIGCNNHDFEINLDLEGTALWYESLDSKDPFFTGNTFTHEAIEEEITYFVREKFDAPVGSVEKYCLSPFTTLKIIPETCLSVIQNQLEKIVISPNPSNGVFFIKGITNETNYKYFVTDITGRIIVEKQTLTSTHIDLNKFEAGIYFLTISNENTVKTFKLININH
jgi:PKD repeat protein